MSIMQKTVFFCFALFLSFGCSSGRNYGPKVSVTSQTYEAGPYATLVFSEEDLPGITKPGYVLRRDLEKNRANCFVFTVGASGSTINSIHGSYQYSETPQ